MSVRIRLRREGSNKKPYFRIVATDIRNSNTGSYLENLGWYDPKRKGDNYNLNMDRYTYWVQNGALATDTVKSFVRKIRKKSSSAPATAGA